ncbi:MAG TPA: helicase C-terminal domain-containing protein, partial [Methylomirabilota bacterium]|nr:helicase C-terminal domain-containing protein [Methylomirabilota bacterium]
MIGPVELAPSGPDLVSQVEEIFSPTGVFSKASNFEYRPQQQEMAVAVARALMHGQHLLVEAGTGVGKSFAYLVPSILFALARNKKAVISTHTINLQEQLVEKDLPVLARVLPVKFSYTMLKGRQNYLCTRRLHKAMQQADGLFTSSEQAELQRIYEWSKTTQDGSLSDFHTEPDAKVWAQVCSERGLCTPKLCGAASEFAKTGTPCFFQRARNRILAADVLVLNHTLFFTLLGGVDEEQEGGILFKNDFVIFDEAHTVEQVAARHIGLGVSSGQMRFALQRLWNPRTEKGLLATLRQGKAVQVVAEVLKASDQFFAHLEEACDQLVREQKPAPRGPETGSGGDDRRSWSELRIRRPDIIADTVTLPLQRLRETVSDLIKSSEDKETGTELAECNRRLLDLREGISGFLKQAAEGYVYWVERTGKAHKNLSINAAPVDVADYLRRRLFAARTSVIMTSATLSVSSRNTPPTHAASGSGRRGHLDHRPAAGGLDYFARRVGGEVAEKLQVGSPFDYERQMRLFVVTKMPDPREPGYQDALVHWIEHFVKQTHGKAFVLFTNHRLMQDVAGRMKPFFERLGIRCLVQGTGTPRSTLLEQFKDDIDSVLFGTDSFWQGVDVPGEALSNVIITR